MSVKKISEAILGVGVDDTTIDLFESQYPVPTGVSYNSYVIRDEKTAVLDTVDARATDPWLENLAEAVLRRGRRRKGTPRGGQGRREPEPGQPHADLRFCAHGALAGSHGQL